MPPRRLRYAWNAYLTVRLIEANGAILSVRVRVLRASQSVECRVSAMRSEHRHELRPALDTRFPLRSAFAPTPTHGRPIATEYVCTVDPFIDRGPRLDSSPTARSQSESSKQNMARASSLRLVLTATLKINSRRHRRRTLRVSCRRTLCGYRKNLVSVWLHVFLREGPAGRRKKGREEGAVTRGPRGKERRW